MRQADSEFERNVSQFLEASGLVLRPNSVRSCRSVLKQFQFFCRQSQIPVNELSRRNVISWMKWLKDRGLSPATRSAHLTWTRRYLHWLRDYTRFLGHPDDLIRFTDFPKIPDRLPRPLDPQLDAKIQALLKNSKSTHDLGLLLMRKTGMRIGELSHLLFRCLRQDARGLYFLKVPLGKLNNERLVPLDQESVQLVQKIQKLTQARSKAEPQYLLASRRRNRVSESMLRIRFIQVLSEITPVPADHVHPHRFRHTYATELLSAGMSLPAVMQLLGHRSVTMTLQYAAITQNTILEEFEAAQRKLGERYVQFKKGGPGFGDLLEQDIQTALHDLGRDLRRKSDGKTPREKKQILLLIKRIRRLQDAIRPLV